LINDFILDDMIWSFSRVETFERCPLCFYFQYIKRFPGIEGCFGQYGTLTHSCLEKYALGELEEYELLSEYKNNFNTVVYEDFPPNAYVDLKENYYKQGYDYFESFSGYDDREILGVEEKYDFKIEDYNFTGVVDLECPEEIIDIKTKGKQHLKRLTKRHKKEEYVQMLDGRYIHSDNFKQLYIYSIPYKEKYGEYPKLLSLSMARMNDWYTVEFNKDDFNNAKQWVTEQIGNIYNAKGFNKGDDTTKFWCDFICGQRINCKYSDKYIEG
jgi:hypothetical protein